MPRPVISPRGSRLVPAWRSRDR